MAITKLNSLAIPNNTIVEADLSYPLTGFSSTGIDDNGTSTKLTVSDAGIDVTGTADVDGTVNSRGLQAKGSPSLSFNASNWMTQQETGVARTYICGPDASTYQPWEIYRATSTGGASLTMKLDASGNVLVGKTSTAFGTAGVEASASNGVWSTRSSLPPLALNRLSTDGSIADFYKDSTTVGSIGAKSGGLFIGSDDAGIFFNDHGGGDLDAIFPYDVGTNTFYNGHVDIGGSSNKFRNIHISGSLSTGDGVTFGSTGGSVTSKTLDDYEEGTFTPSFANDGATTYTTRSGEYIKIGGAVYYSIFLRINAEDSSKTGSAEVIGLPFASKSSATTNFAASIVGDNNWDLASSNLVAYVSPNESKVRFYKNSGSNLFAVSINDIGSDGILYITGWYAT